MRIHPAQITHPISFWMSIVLAITTALLSVAWHGLLFLVAVTAVVGIIALPFVTRYEARHVEDRP